MAQPRDPKTGRFIKAVKGVVRRVTAVGQRVRKPSRPMGMGARIGAVIMGVGPLAVSTAVAVNTTMAEKKSLNLSGPSAVHGGLLHFVNNMAVGFGINAPYPSYVGSREDGSAVTVQIGKDTVPRGSHWALVGVGLLAIVSDRLAGFIADRKGGVKIPFTNILAVGGK